MTKPLSPLPAAASAAAQLAQSAAQFGNGAFKRTYTRRHAAAARKSPTASAAAAAPTAAVSALTASLATFSAVAQFSSPLSSSQTSAFSAVPFAPVLPKRSSPRRTSPGPLQQRVSPRRGTSPVPPRSPSRTPPRSSSRTPSSFSPEMRARDDQFSRMLQTTTPTPTNARPVQLMAHSPAPTSDRAFTPTAAEPLHSTPQPPSPTPYSYTVPSSRQPVKAGHAVEQLNKISSKRSVATPAVAVPRNRANSNPTRMERLSTSAEIERITPMVTNVVLESSIDSEGAESDEPLGGGTDRSRCRAPDADQMRSHRTLRFTALFSIDDVAQRGASDQ